MCYISSDTEYLEKNPIIETGVGEISGDDHVYVLFYVSCEGIEHIYGIHKTHGSAKRAAEGYVDMWREKGVHNCGHFRIATWVLFP